MTQKPPKNYSHFPLYMYCWIKQIISKILGQICLIFCFYLPTNGLHKTQCTLKTPHKLLFDHIKWK